MSRAVVAIALALAGCYTGPPSADVADVAGLDAPDDQVSARDEAFADLAASDTPDTAFQDCCPSWVTVDQWHQCRTTERGPRCCYGTPSTPCESTPQACTMGTVCMAPLWCCAP